MLDSCSIMLLALHQVLADNHHIASTITQVRKQTTTLKMTGLTTSKDYIATSAAAALFSCCCSCQRAYTMPAVYQALYHLHHATT
jgi:hypothetical protein